MPKFRNVEVAVARSSNRFHDPHDKSPDILKLCELHDAMDRAVLEAYGRHDLAQTARCEFLLDYEEEEVDSSQFSVLSCQLTVLNRPLTTDNFPHPPCQRFPWRLRWPDDFRDEVFARLLELNVQRHPEELSVGSFQLSEKSREKNQVSQQGQGQTG